MFEHSIAKPLVNAFRIDTPNDLILPMTILFCLSAILAGIWRLLILWVSTKYSYALGADFGRKIFKDILHQPYIYHKNKNSSEIISVITIKIDHVVNSVIFQILAMLVSIAIAFSIILALILISLKITIISSLSFMIIYSLIFKFERQKVWEKSELISKNATRIVKILSESRGNIKDIILDSNQKLYQNKFRFADVPMRNAQVYHQFIGQAPRYLIEALGIVIIAIIAYIQIKDSGHSKEVIPILGAFALGAQRLLPAAQQIFAAITNINGRHASLRDLLTFLGEKEENQSNQTSNTELTFKKSIQLKNVDFSFNQNERKILNNISLNIFSGERVGIVGETGSGKSTIIDLLMGLLEPTAGSLLVDEKEVKNSALKCWWKHLSHVPQNIFLIDGTIQENVTLTEQKKDYEDINLNFAIKIAQLEKTVENLQDGLNTFVGERGARLSGGEIQRIGIARALYKRKKLIILDEATSALDVAIEKKIMNGIDKLTSKPTIIMIAHRVRSLINCDKIILVERGSVKILQSGTKQFNDLTKN